LADQRELYAAPFKPSNIKRDALVLAGTGALLATDRRIEKQLPDGPLQRYQNSSNVALGGLAASLAGLWVYGIKTTNPHARETGSLELETLTNTFLVYAPIQFISRQAATGRRQRKRRLLTPSRDEHVVSWRSRDVHMGNGYSSRSRVP